MSVNIPVVTVLMPVYNCELYIKEAINSILNQTFTDYELIIIDDCSTDSTAEIIKDYSDSRIIFFEKDTNSGYTNSLNYGLSVAKGEYIARMDGDDISLPTRLEKQFHFLNSNPDIILCGTSYSIIQQRGVFYMPQTYEEIKINLLLANCLVHPSVMFRKDVFLQHNLLYDLQMEPAEDYDLWVKLAAIGKLHNLQECLLLYRVHNAQVSAIRSKKQKEAANQVRLKALQPLNTVLSSAEKVVYLKAVESTENLKYDEFTILLDLKIKLIASNKIEYFRVN